MKLLLFGAGGMLARAIEEQPRQHEIIPVTQAECDICDAAAVAAKVASVAPQAIINAAAYTNVDGAEEHEALALAVNADGVANIAAAAKKSNARLVHLSTDYVFAGDREQGYVENDVPAPKNAYGRSKAAGEQALQGSGCDWLLVRTAWLYGPHGKNFVDTMLRLGAEKKTLKVVNDQTGSPTFTRDLAAAILDLLEQHMPSGVYHRTNSGSVTWYDFAKEIFRQAKLRVTAEPISGQDYGLPAVRPAWSILQTTKLPPLRNWQVALQAYFQEKGIV